MPDLRADQIVPADAAVVADLHEVIDLRAAADHRRAIRPAIDRRSRADFDVIADFDIAELRAELVPAIDRRIAKAIRAQHRVGMKIVCSAEDRVLVKHGVGKQRALRADLAAVENPHAAVNDAAFGDFDIRADERLRMHFDAGGDLRRRMNERRGADSVAVRLPRRMKMGHDLGKRRVYVGDGNERSVRRLQAVAGTITADASQRASCGASFG